jgi:hypothetical protein
MSTPVLCDVNRDGNLDIAGSAITLTSTFTCNLYVWNTGITLNPSKITIPNWQYNTRHNGVYGDIQIIGISPASNEIPKLFIDAKLSQSV